MKFHRIFCTASIENESSFEIIQMKNINCREIIYTQFPLNFNLLVAEEICGHIYVAQDVGDLIDAVISNIKDS